MSDCAALWGETVSEPMYNASGRTDGSGVQEQVSALLREGLALLDLHDAPLAIRARLADLIEDLGSDWS